jgi:Zn-dependent protease
MLGMPEPTAYDLRFRFLGIPVRVHPFFWLCAALIRGNDPLPYILMWIPCVFVSILVHEFGHGLMSRVFHYSPSIVLYGMGGLCYSEAERQTPWQRLAVLIAGPGAGLLFFLSIWGGYQLLGRPVLSNRVVGEVLNNLVWINLWWSIFNLFPIWPLDGGQITGVVLTMFNRRKGMNWTHVIGLVLAGLLGLWAFQANQFLLGIFLALFAVLNFQILQAQHHAAKYGALEDDADWWKR